MIWLALERGLSEYILSIKWLLYYLNKYLKFEHAYDFWERERSHIAHLEERYHHFGLWDESLSFFGPVAVDLGFFAWSVFVLYELIRKCRTNVP